MYPPKPTTSVISYRFQNGRVVPQRVQTTLEPETRLYSYHQFSDGSSMGSTHLTDIEALQYNLTANGGCFTVPFTQSEHVRAAANDELRRYTFRRFKDGSITGEAWMTDEDAVQFNLNSSKAVYVVPWVPSEQLFMLPQPSAPTEVPTPVNV